MNSIDSNNFASSLAQTREREVQNFRRREIIVQLYVQQTRLCAISGSARNKAELRLSQPAIVVFFSLRMKRKDFPLLDRSRSVALMQPMQCSGINSSLKFELQWEYGDYIFRGRLVQSQEGPFLVYTKETGHSVHAVKIVLDYSAMTAAKAKAGSNNNINRIMYHSTQLPQ